MAKDPSNQWPEADYLKRGNILEFDALAIAIIYGFRHFLGPYELTIDVKSIEKKMPGKSALRVMPDFAIKSGEDVVALGECKASWGNKSKVVSQLKLGIEKIQHTSVARRFLLMPVQSVVDLSDELKERFPHAKVLIRKYAQGKVHSYQFIEDGIHWDIYEYQIGLELAVCGALVTEADETTNTEALLFLGQLLYEKACIPQTKLIRNNQVARLMEEDLLPGERPEEERQIALLLQDAWAFLTEEYLRDLAEKTSTNKGWIRTFQKLLDYQFRHRKDGPVVSQEAIPAMRPSFAAESSGGDRRSMGIRIPQQKNLGLVTFTVVEARSGMGKSVSMIQEANSLAEALLHSGGLIGITALPFHIDLKKVEDSLFNRYSEYINQTNEAEYALEGSMLPGTGLLFLCQYSHTSSVAALHDSIKTRNKKSTATEENLSIAASPLAVAAIMCKFPVTLLVDGYDHVVSTGRGKLLKPLIENLSRQGVSVDQVVLTSRYGFGAAQAFDLAEGHRTTAMTIDQFRMKEQQRYLDRWVAFMQSRPRYVEQYGSTGREWSDYLRWLETKTKHAATHDVLDPFSTLCLANSLLFNISILVFLFENLQDETGSITPTESAFIDDLLGKVQSMVGPPDKNVDIDRGNPLRSTLDSLCFSLLCRPKKQVGLATEETRVVVESRIPQSNVNEYEVTTVGEWCRDHALFSGSWPIVHFRSYTSGAVATGRLEFIHPSFHEFFAGCYLADCLDRGVLPIPQQFKAGAESAAPIPEEELFARIQDNPAIAALQLRTVIRWIGPLAFKYAVSRLVSDALSPNGRLHGTFMLFEVLLVDQPLQQYLYDAAFLDEIVLELAILLDISEVREDARFFVLAKKLMGHVLYGQADQKEVGLGIQHLKSALETIDKIDGGSSDEINARVVRVFLEDHIWNRSDYDSQKEQDIINLVFHSLEEKPSIDMYPLLFRSGIFLSHTGNHRLRAMENLADSGVHDETALEFDEAVDAYWIGIVMRYLCLPLAIEKNLESFVQEKLNEWGKLPDWLPAVRADLLSEHKQVEVSMDQGQAIGDIAHQFSCLSQVYVWQYIHLLRENAGIDVRRKKYDLAVKAQELSAQLWDKAVESLARDNAGTIKYYLWYPQTKLGIRILKNHFGQSTENLSEVEIEAELQAAHNKAGIHYARAEHGVRRNLQIIGDQLKKFG